MAETENTKKEQVTSNAPNMRFASAFLDYANHKRAVPGETMIDRRTGEIVYKRFEDGKRLYFAQENVHLNNYVTQIKCFLAENKRSYVRPRPSICNVCDDTYYMAINTELVDFYFADDAEEQSLLNGGTLQNPYPDEYSIILEQNGMFVQLDGRPRDRATISFLAAKYDIYYKNYTGDDPDALAKKAMYEKPYYQDSQAVLNYTIRYYNSSDEVYAEQTSDGYIRFNELSYIPFEKTSIYPRTEVAYSTIRVNSISTPKLAGGKKLLETESENAMLTRFLDSVDIGAITCNIGCFITPTDQNFKLPNPENTVPILIMGLDEFETELDKVGNVSSATGIYFSINEPDIAQWNDITLWGEIISKVYGYNSSEKTGASTVISDLEKSFGSIEYLHGKFTLDDNDLDGYLIKILGARKTWITKW